MKTEEIRALSPEEVHTRLDEAREAYFKMRFQFSTGQLKDTAKLRRARRDVARLATLLREQQLGAEAEEPAAGKAEGPALSKAEGRQA
jgi:large subunit ribosomal protein L29